MAKQSTGLTAALAALAGLAAGASLMIWLGGGPPEPEVRREKVLEERADGDRLGQLERELRDCRRDRESLVQGVSGCIEDGNQTAEGLTKQLESATSALDRFRRTIESPMSGALDRLAQGLVSIIIQFKGNERLKRCTGYLVRRGDDVRLFTAGHCVADLDGEAWLHLVRYRYDASNALLMPDLQKPLVSFEHTVCRRDGVENPEGTLAGRTGTVDLASYELVTAGRASRCLEISATRDAPKNSGREPPAQLAAALLEAARTGEVRTPNDYEQVYFVAHICQRPQAAESQCTPSTDGWSYLPMVATVLGRTQDRMPFFALNQRARPGDSGGPVIALDGSLLGLVSVTHLGNSLSFFTPVSAIWE